MFLEQDMLCTSPQGLSPPKLPPFLVPKGRQLPRGKLFCPGFSFHTRLCAPDLLNDLDKRNWKKVWGWRSDVQQFQ